MNGSDTSCSLYLPLTQSLSDTDDMSMISVVLNVSNEGIKDGLFNSNSIKKFRCKHLHYKLCASDVVNSRHCNVMQYNKIVSQLLN